MSKGSGGSGMTRGDRRRNVRRERLRAVLPRDGAVIGIDLAEEKQALAVIDHDVRVLARKTVRVKAFRLGEALDWAAGQARAKGSGAVTVACEPTGPRWLQVQRLCAERGLPLVCVQPLASHIAREQQDYTTHKTDEADCVMIARRPVRRMGGLNLLVLLTLTWMSLSRPEDVCQVGGRKTSGRTKQATGHGQEALRVLEKRLHAICMTPPAPGRETMTLSLRRPDDQVAVSSETLHSISTPDRLETRLSARGA